MGEVKKIALTLAVILLMTFGVCIGFARSTPILPPPTPPPAPAPAPVVQNPFGTPTPGFGASGDWGLDGGTGTTAPTPPPPTPVQQIPSGTSTPGFGMTG